ncbi:acetyltransferase [Dehalogenimonas formicexedens]|uniref:Acetyltransferase n=1 Tax=Dehalogenimonas formicexedens TaxID=1839801 RepID=A0A1P8F678_9CHLR|nr:acetate--CoA ligase [Dehalogenimonas formicexedens]APV43973.1 acetyltransferase [Dehalogenimonas formicexedens]
MNEKRRSLESLLKPRSVAVIGASRHDGSLGKKIFDNLLESSFKGPVFPINPNAKEIASIKAYPSIFDVPEPVELAVIAVPAEFVLEAAEQCGLKGVKSLVVISAGFAENGKEGVNRQRDLASICRHHGMRLVGPNCMGVLNTDPDVSLNATFSHVFPPRGDIAMATQSGALGLVILEYAKNLNIGLSTFASVGNRADVSSNDLMEYWRDDPDTSVIMLYLESFGNPRKFARLARSISPHKPIVAVKSGRTAQGSKAAASHTGALATVDVAVDALFAQTGIIRVDDLEQLFDVSDVLSRQPLPKGNRIAILTNGGGPGALAADACSAAGLELTHLSAETVAGLRALLPVRASLGNPIDITDVGAAEYRGALSLLAGDNNIDSVIVIFIPPVFACPEEVATVIRDLAPEFRRRGKPLIASFMGQRGCVPGTTLPAGTAGVPSFAFPEAAVHALAKALEYSRQRQKPKGTAPEFLDIDRERAKKIIDSALDGWLEPDTAFSLLQAYGIMTQEIRAAENLERAIDAAQEIGFPVALKIDSTAILHKTEAGGVSLEIGSPEELKQAYDDMMEKMRIAGLIKGIRGVYVQKMAETGTEVIAGINHDAIFGPLILFGLGGIYTELFQDSTVRITPLTDADAKEMVRSVKAYRLLEGFRGAPPADVPAIEELLLRLSALVEDVPRIKEMDLNPVRVFGEGRGYAVLDARIRLGSTERLALPK